jgi:hypothetical protein
VQSGEQEIYLQRKLVKRYYLSGRMVCHIERLQTALGVHLVLSKIHSNRWVYRNTPEYAIFNMQFYWVLEVSKMNEQEQGTIHRLRDWFVNKYPVQVMTIYLWWHRFQVWFVIFCIVYALGSILKIIYP